MTGAVIVVCDRKLTKLTWHVPRQIWRNYHRKNRNGYFQTNFILLLEQYCYIRLTAMQVLRSPYIP